MDDSVQGGEGGLSTRAPALHQRGGNKEAGEWLTKNFSHSSPSCKATKTTYFPCLLEAMHAYILPFPRRNYSLNRFLSRLEAMHTCFKVFHPRSNAKFTPHLLSSSKQYVNTYFPSLLKAKEGVHPFLASPRNNEQQHPPLGQNRSNTYLRTRFPSSKQYTTTSFPVLSRVFPFISKQYVTKSFRFLFEAMYTGGEKGRHL